MDPCTHLLYRLDSPSRIDIATDLAIPIVAARGWEAVTPATVAQAARCSRQAVAQWFGGQEALRRAVGQRFTARLRHWTEIRVHLDGPVAMLPETSPLLDCTRVWLALHEAAGRDPEARSWVTAIEEDESLALTRWLQRQAWDKHRVHVSALAPATNPLHHVLDGARLRLARGLDLALATAPVLEAGRLAVDTLLAGACLTSSKSANAPP